MWLKLLTILRRGGWPAALLLLWSGNAAAADVNFNGGAVSNCTLSGKTYTCSNIPLGATDRAVIAGSYTVEVSGGFAPSYHQQLSMSSSSVLRTTNSTNIDLSNINPANVSVGGGTLTAGGKFTLGSATTINGAVNAASLSANSGNTITGAVSVTGLVDLASANKIGGSLSGGTIVTNSGVTLSGSVTATTSFYLGSGSSLTGNITAPTITLAAAGSTIKGDIKASGKLDMGSNVGVTGTVTAGSAILRASGARITGDAIISGTLELEAGTNVTGKASAATLTMRATNARIDGDANISGDVLMESGTSIGGNLTARNVTTKDGNAVISGNATVNSIYIDGNNRVDGCIICIGAPAKDPYQCVSKPSWYNYTPKCSTPSSGIHHFQISHSGVGLTCQAQTVEIKACTDLNCTGTSSTATKVTLAPGGGEVQVSGTTSAQVRYASATGDGGITLSATAASVTGTTVCPNAATGTNNCQMVFKDEGLVLSVPDHVALDPNVKLNVQALKTSPQGSCVPLVQGATVPVKFSCAYLNPLPASANPVGVTVGGTNLVCGGGTTDVSLGFNNDGLATAPLQYREVGLTSLTAAYTANSLGASGGVQFTTAPAKIKVEPIRINSPATFFSATAFAKASEPFKLRLSALNYQDQVTKNFGRETPTPQNFLILPPVLTNPSGGQRPLTIGSYKGIVDGVADAADGTPGRWRFDDTGTLEVTVTLDNSAGYLGKSSAGFKPTQKTSLTFVPDHFDVTLLAGAPMDCAKTGLVNPCGGDNANGKFIYSEQPFLVAVNAYIGLKDATNSYYLSPQNYVGTAARAIALSAWSATDANVAVPASVGDFNWNKTPPASSPFSFGYNSASQKTIGALTPAAVGTLPRYIFNATPTAPTTIRLRVKDSDGASSAGFGEPLLTIVSGRMEIANVSGPLTGKVPVTAKAQYWSGKAYVFNSQYNSDKLPLSRTEANGTTSYFVRFDKCKNGLAGANAALPCAGGPVIKLASADIKFGNGSGIFMLDTPVPAPSRNGSVDVALQNGSEDLIKYLPSGSGTVVFGVYRSGPLIYTREVYN